MSVGVCVSCGSPHLYAGYAVCAGCLPVLDVSLHEEDSDQVADPVNSPAHYTSSPAVCKGCGRQIECIDVAEHAGFNLGNVHKYCWRAGLKGKTVEDLKKARWYLDREIARLESGK